MLIKRRIRLIRWFDHVMRRNDSEAVRETMEVNVEGKSGRPKKKWIDRMTRKKLF